MMIVISSTDFQKLSASCQRELLDLLSCKASGQQQGEDETSLPFEDFDSVYNESEWLAQPNFISGIGLVKGASAPVLLHAAHQEMVESSGRKVVGISIEQARDLIANVSDKSKEALKLFTSGQPVSLEVLVGPDAPYRDHNELKRSFVGAVNRRLRTVTENRSAVLFSSDRDKTRIRITPLSATALRQALDVPEPLPSFDFYDPAGQQVSADSESARTFTKLLTSAWQDQPMRPTEGRTGLVAAQVIAHLLAHGFSLVTGKPMVAQRDDRTVCYEYAADSNDPTGLPSEMELDGNFKSSDEAGSYEVRSFLKHPCVPEILGTIP